jgi:hypothetical protein
MAMSRRHFIQTSAGMTAYLALGSTLTAVPNSDELAFLTISDLSEIIHSRKVSPVEATRVMLQRIEKFNPVLNAYITVTSEQAMKAAQDAEKEIQQGKWRGPLHGVPVVLKDLFCWREDHRREWCIFRSTLGMLWVGLDKKNCFSTIKSVAAPRRSISVNGGTASLVLSRKRPTQHRDRARRSFLPTQAVPFPGVPDSLLRG